MSTIRAVRIKKATKADVPLILTFIRELAEYEKALARVSATEDDLRTTLFGPTPYAEAVIAFEYDQPIAFALYFFSYTSFAAQPGLYLEDIYVRPPFRGSGVGRQLFAHLAETAIERNCVRMEWSVLDWNESAIRFYEKLLAERVDDWLVFRLSHEKLVQLATPAIQ